jgi:putative SOS response-associated peptidase YedK
MQRIGTVVRRCFDEISPDWNEALKSLYSSGRTCTIITGEPNEFVQKIHTRMPVILPEEHHDSWLSGEAGKEIFSPLPGRPDESVAGQSEGALA